METTSTKTSMRATIAALPVGGKVAIRFGERTYTSVRNTACLLGLELGRQYRVHLDRAARAYEVTRYV